MAQRRMVSLKVTDTDLFLDMPLSTQALYFHLITRADDDGFFANPKKIMRMISCTEDDLKILMSKEFVIPFESGVCVIKHWKIHNLIRSDRYNETIYKEEKASLKEDHNKVYIPYVIPNDNQMDTQSRSGEVRLGKGSSNKKKKPPAKSQAIVKSHPLYQSINESFLSKNGGAYTNYPKEGKAINQLISKCEQRYPENPGDFIRALIEQYYKMVFSTDKFWNNQPFLASVLNSSGIFDRVLKKLQVKDNQDINIEALEGIPW